MPGGGSPPSPPRHAAASDTALRMAKRWSRTGVVLSEWSAAPILGAARALARRRVDAQLAARRVGVEALRPADRRHDARRAQAVAERPRARLVGAAVGRAGEWVVGDEV